jgi:hypothetical protein
MSMGAAQVGKGDNLTREIQGNFGMEVQNYQAGSLKRQRVDLT